MCTKAPDILSTLNASGLHSRRPWTLFGTTLHGEFAEPAFAQPPDSLLKSGDL